MYLLDSNMLIAACMPEHVLQDTAAMVIPGNDTLALALLSVILALAGALAVRLRGQA